MNKSFFGDRKVPRATKFIPMTPVRAVALYLRVSTRDQSFASQEKVLRDYCRRRGWKKLIVYSEKVSGSAGHRVVLDELMRDARAGKFDVVAVYKLDRFGRSLIHLLQLVKELTLRKIGFVTATEPIDTTGENPMAELLISIFGILAQQEGERIRERTRDGLAAAAKQGRVGGRRRKNDAAIEKAFLLKKKNPEMETRRIAAAVGLSESYVSLLLRGERTRGTK